MIVSKCPLRISLVGGSSDLQESINKNGVGGVISFPCTLYTYISITKRYDKYYQISYLKTERVLDPNQIKNDVAREVIKYFNLPPITVSFTCDIPSDGSGLANSSSYLVGMVSAVSKLLNLELSQHRSCEIALEIERRFNPLTGYQDTYGCGVGGFKRIDFNLAKSGDVVISYTFLSDNVVRNTNMYLIPTNVQRLSTDILSTVDVNKTFKLYSDTVDMYDNICNEDSFYSILNRAWINKKNVSNKISNEELDKIEDRLRNEYNIKGLKLCGAGGGGYFLIATDSEVNEGYIVNIDTLGVQSWKI